MSSLSYIQASLAGGEMGPGLYGRVDLAAYQTSLKVCRNFVTQPSGGARRRGGFRFVAEVFDSSKAVRLIPFVFNAEQAYALEVGEGYTRVIKNGGLLTSGGTPVKITTPWLEGDIPQLRKTQSADVLTLCHPDYVPGQITRTTETSWTYSDFVAEFGPFQDENEDVAQTIYASAVSGTIALTAAGFTFSGDDAGRLFKVVQKDYGQAWEPGKSIPAAGTIRRVGGNYYAAAAGTYPATTGTSMPANLKDSWSDGAVTWTFIHPGFGIAKIVPAVTYAAGTTYALGEICTYGGKNYISLQAANTGHQPATSPTWWGLTAAAVQATVVQRIPDAHIGSGNTTYRWARGAWCEADGYPCATTYHQQREFFGGSPKAPQSVWGSQTDDFTNFGVTTPLLDSDAVTYPLAGREVNQVRHLVSLGSALIALTSDSYWTLVGDADGNALTPNSVQADVQSYVGASDVEPLTVVNEVLFVGATGQAVYNVGYSLEDRGYVGDDLTQFANHLFEGYEIRASAYQRHPFGVAWFVRSDGILLGLTYVKRQKVIAWHRHETDGLFESCCVVPEGGRDVLYVVVRRYINGAWRRYIERMDPAYQQDQRNYFFVDSGLSYNGWNTTSTTVTISAGSGWNQDGSVVINSSQPIFSYPAQTDQSDALVFEMANGKRLAFRILSTSSTTQALAVPNRIVPDDYKNVARKDWAWGRTTFVNLDHLEGKTVQVLTDGNVATATVSGGFINVQSPSVIVHAGLGYNSDLVTLDLAVFNGESIRDKRKQVVAVRCQVADTRGLMYGRPGGELMEVKQRGNEDYSQPVALKTGLMSARLSTTWEDAGSVQISQRYPLPAHILSIMPEVQTGGTV